MTTTKLPGNYIIEYAGENSDLFKAEYESLRSHTTLKFIKDRLYLTEADPILLRMAYVRKISKAIMTLSKKSQFTDQIWNGKLQEGYKIEFHKPISAKTKKIILQSLPGNIKVKLDNPVQVIWIYETDKDIIIADQMELIRPDYETRKNQHLTVSQPISLHPRLARFMVNLTGIRTGTLTDPMCGTGAILIEAALCGIRTEGYDINSFMVEAAQKNMSQFTKKCSIKQKDILKNRKKYEFLVSDFPYGRNTHVDHDFYEKALIVIRGSLINFAVIAFPDNVDRKMIEYHGFKVEKEIKYRIHKSLTKKIYLLK